MSSNPVEALLDHLVGTGEINGGAIAISRQGEPVLRYFTGLAAPNRPATRETIWPLASISKLYTAATVMALVECGAFALSTRVCEIVPAFSGDGRERTRIRHLLTHTSGLIYESPDMPALLEAQTSLEEIVDDVFVRPLLFKPEQHLSYSDLGFALLGRVVSIAMKRPFPDLVREYVLIPAGLSDTRFPIGSDEEQRIAEVTGVFAEDTDGAMYNSRYARGLAHPAFGVAATLDDLIAFGNLFAPNATRRILSEAAVATMTTDQTGGNVLEFAPEMAEADTSCPWGLGFMVNRSLGRPELLSPHSFGHGGATGCALWIDPERDLVIAFVSNAHLNLVALQPFMVRLTRVFNTAAAYATR